MNRSIYEVIIIGAGHAGLSASYYLKHLGLEHIVFERGRIGETWRTQRWDNFKMLTPNRLNALPGHATKFRQPDGFASAQEFVATLREYVNNFVLPISENSNVISVEKLPGSPVFSVKVSHDNEPVRTYDAWQVIVAPGMQNEKLFPSFARLVSRRIIQIHSSEYKNPTQLVEGTVLIVGSGQSGCQIADDLLEAGRSVVVACTPQAFLPRTYRDKDIMDWMILCKVVDEPISSDDPYLGGKNPVIETSNADQGDASLRSLAKRGALIVGSLTNASGEAVSIADNASAVIKSVDKFTLSIKELIDSYIIDNQLQIPPVTEGDESPVTVNASDALNLNLQDHDITTIVWATGHTGNLNFLRLPIFDERGTVIQQSGVTAVDGLYVIGSPWQGLKKNAFIFGIKDDTSFVTNKIYSILR
ncbi:MAG: NAD(P)/FAD-dependent oxidoreductase [Chryseolinea sp.]